MPNNSTRIATLVRRIENAPDFGYDDEAVELNRLLAAEGKAWLWDDATVKIVTQAEYDALLAARRAS
jgi:hypothetical protein